ncbi:hypothetical protein IF1G_10164 [Cordyceps javanica]|uniref:N-acetyltransferase domain-containing protein n=1 Tax=Cordyceps javanica TaxID=43265 RepID=A0A545VMF7_9HYPO|nr:hypothetical protein IF1G_10164 [Cordyceps javanica]TQW02923.1 acetyltransferase (GNAT) family domain-containing protein [Cordyceps javanica]
MSNAERLRTALPANHVEKTFLSWAYLRGYRIEIDFDCLTIVRSDSEDLRETVAFEPKSTLLETLIRALEEPTLRMMTVITTVDGDDKYAAIAKERGVKFVGDGGKIMAAKLSPRPEEATPEDKLASIDPAFVAQVDEQNGCCAVRIMAGKKLASTGKSAVSDGIATFDGMFTDMEYQRRGLATCVLAFLVRWAVANGARVGMLNASPHGQMLYSGLGWTSVYNVVSMGGEPAIGFMERMRQKYAPKK